MRPTRRASSYWLQIVLLFLLAVAIAYAAESSRRVLNANADKSQADDSMVRAMGLVAPSEKSLAPQFTDSQSRLLADPPASADQLIDPQTIVVAHLDSTDPESPSTSWPQFEHHLADVTGRKVTDLVFDNGPDQLEQIKKGAITLVALHAADAPFLVNNLGYQPVAVLGADSGASGNHLDIIVPPDSGIQSLADLRGQNLVCTVPSSITGYRAAVALLMENCSLRPNVDYTITWSLKQKDSINGVANKHYQAAAISDDKLQTLLSTGAADPKTYRVVYQSGVIPRTTIGWFYNLNPALAEKVRSAILSFAPTTQPAAEDEDATAADTAPLHFIAIDYKKDFQLVREIDARFDPRLDAKTKKVAAVTPDTQPVN